MVEITLAMAFVAIILIGIATTSMNLMAIYNKGITMRNVNAVVRSVTRDIKDSVFAAGQPISIYAKNEGGPAGHVSGGMSDLYDEEVEPGTGNKKFIDSGLDYVVFKGFDSSNDAGGRLCTGSYTYMWNYNKPLTDSIKSNYQILGKAEGKGLQYYKSAASGGVNVPINFVKVKDNTKKLCRPVELGAGSPSNGTEIPSEFAKNLTPVMGEGERNLRVYNFDIQEGDEKFKDLLAENQTGGYNPSLATRYFSTFYKFKITLGSSMYNDEYLTGNNKHIAKAFDYETNSLSHDVEPICKTSGKDFSAEYCALNQIEFVALAGSSNNNNNN